ncbi:hypothetical protein T07_10556 [Trichinella nelsoni]|uniref:Uncharacterized protein n=1 Tax=Trichinella nelsoni TaxID=6336 RepID=A0A0V0RD08_9BILA|nr:hypothetical protein T07_10556 [Trichinella nelsoni]
MKQRIRKIHYVKRYWKLWYPPTISVRLVTPYRSCVRLVVPPDYIRALSDPL